MKSKKIIIDTNLWISFLITKKFDSLDNLIDDGKVKLIFSEELIEEFLIVTKREKLSKYFSNSDVKKILSLFNQYGRLVIVKSSVFDCRDSKDNFLLNLAIDGRADFLVTGDSDLLVIEKYQNTRIITFQELKGILE